MASINQEFRLKQQAVMTQKLQESIKILQLNSIELSNYISDKLDDNPLLDADAPMESETLEEIPGNEKDNSDELEVSWGDVDKISAAVYESSDKSNVSARKGESGSTYNFEDILGTYGSKRTFHEHVSEQIACDIDKPRHRIIALFLLDMVDESGYIKIDFDSIIHHLKCNKEEVVETLNLLQNFDPPGAFARSVSECLKLQLIDKEIYCNKFAALIKNLNLLAEGKIKPLLRKCEVKEDELSAMIEIVRSLNPRPATSFSSELVQEMRPDIFLKKEGGDWTIELNSKLVPKITVKKDYYDKLKKQNLNKEEKKYLSEKYGSASWLKKSVDYRTNTLLNVANEIVVRQREFFDKGINYIYSMTLEEVAEAIGVNKSTVSRVTMGKYIATPMGVFELRYFFSSAVSRVDSDGTCSSRYVKHLIKKTISEEGKKINSDEEIALILSGQDISISRRTVAKYREAMKIPTSSKRRRSKKLELV
jgi:RNA polymerase sigma-54 factor